MVYSKKKIKFVSWSYGLIVILANICGILIPNALMAPEMRHDYMEGWLFFLSDYSHILDPIQYFSFVLPTVLCSLYMHNRKNPIENRLINLPIAFSTIGISGWAFYLLEETFLLLVARKIGYHIEYFKILSYSFFYVSLEAIITFTLAYFIMETIHRKFVLPQNFPDGQLSKIKGLKRPSTRILFIINYISVTLFPIFYIWLMYRSVSQKSGISAGLNIYIVLALVIAMGLLISVSFESYFEKPLKKFKERIQKINDGDLNTKVNIVTNDSFGELSDIFNDMTDSIQQKTRKILEVQNSVITGMAIMVESRDNSTGGHIKRTSECVRIFMSELIKTKEYMHLSESFCIAMIKAAPMHDLGKIAVDDSVLRKPGKFTDEEYEIMKTHSAEGARIVSSVLENIDDQDFKNIAINVAHYHHEKWNGQGYPTNISGEQIPLEARIMALADVFDALVSKRCYKDSFSYDKAFGIIEESLGSHFDPELGKVFLQCRPKLEELYKNY